MNGISVRHIHCRENLKSQSYFILLLSVKRIKQITKHCIIHHLLALCTNDHQYLRSAVNLESMERFLGFREL